MRALLLLALLFSTDRPITNFTDRVHPSLSPIRLSITLGRAASPEAVTIEQISISSARGSTQVIRFTEAENGAIPTFEGSIINPVALQDVDFDGYKDLWVLRATSANGETWAHLFRWNPKNRQFERYAKFSELPSPSADHREKVVRTSISNGCGGCCFEYGVYKWRGGELVPVRLVSQEMDTSDHQLRRSLQTWSETGEKMVQQLPVTPHCQR